MGRLTRIRNGRRRSEKRKHVKLLVKQTVYKDFMEENQPQKVNSKSINTIKILRLALNLHTSIEYRVKDTGNFSSILGCYAW